MDSINSLTTALAFIINIGCELNSIMLITMRIDICDRMWCNCGKFDVYSIPNGTTFVIGFMIKISLLTSVLNTLVITFDGFNSHLDKLSEGNIARNG